jgi:hypothetical protein
MPPLELTFAGNEWRVEERPERPADRRFAVVGKSPTTFGVEVELCAVQYRPHAEAIAALPELTMAATLAHRLAKLNPGKNGRRARDVLANAIAKAEGRAHG